MHRPNYLYCRFQTVFSPQIKILNVMLQLNRYANRKIASKRQKHKCILQESCKTVRRWQRSVLHVS